MSTTGAGGETNPRTIRAKDARRISIEIDHREVACPEGVTVLRAAELNGISIPSLCSHKDLSPFGGCRLCMVEIGGMRGYPLACSTLVQPGMKVLTESTTLQEMRREILELILSEHPSSCLICSEKAECRTTLDTIRKSGVSTGCRYCPNDGQCELQDLAERFGIEEIHYPILYHGYEAEHDDPFFDRDYNICILCGRCVRMCQEVRGTAVLAFKHRGPRTQVGTAYGRSHVEAGCEFCGACVSVCPTGALAEKSSKWDGRPDGLAVSTCPFCALGCRIELHHRKGRLSKVGAHLDPEINDGQLCVRGAFCLPETTHHHARGRKPVLKRGAYNREVSWEEALEEAASRLRDIDPDQFLMLVSPDLTNESLYAARRFVRSGLKSERIGTTAHLPGGVDRWTRLFSLPVSLQKIASADAVIAIGLDSRFHFSVAGVQIRRALREGARLVTIDPRESNLARMAHRWLRPAPGKEGSVLRALAARVLRREEETAEGSGVPPQEIEEAAATLLHGPAHASAGEPALGDLAVVVGPAAFALDADGTLIDALLRLGERERTSILPLYHGANTRGMLELGLLQDGSDGDGSPAGRNGRPKVIYLVGEAPFSERPDCECLIVQDLYPPPFEVDIFLPAASFAEAEGTLTNIEGRVQDLVRIEELPDGAITGFVRPDWFIFGALAEKLGLAAESFQSAAKIRQEIHAEMPSFPVDPNRLPRQLRLTADAPVSRPPSEASTPRALPSRQRGKLPARTPGAARNGEFLLVLEPGGFRHRGIDLAAVVEGLAELHLEKGARMHPDDLEKLGIPGGGEAVLLAGGDEIQVGLKADPDCPRGTVYLHRSFVHGGGQEDWALPFLGHADGIPRPVEIRLRKGPDDGVGRGRAAARAAAPGART